MVTLLNTAIEFPTDDARSDATTCPPWYRRGPVLVALVGFVAFCVVVLVRATSFLEPDDYAYRASIAALGHGEILLTNAQYVALQHQLATTGGQGILQWHHLASGKWISEKNPGYPFFAVLFYLVNLLRVAPLFYGGVACVGLYHGARQWLGRWAGTIAVWLYCFSGAALVFAWRATMPSFTDASLIAAGCGGLLWTLLRTDAPTPRRAVAGLASFVALEGAVFIRYTNVGELVVATLAVAIFRRASRLSWRTVCAWWSSVVVFGAFLLLFNLWAYGHATSTGYSAGEITFSPSAFWPNLESMPRPLAVTMPIWLVAAVAVVAIATRFASRARRASLVATASRDAAVAAALLAAWLVIWLLYFTYTWTVGMGGGDAVHVIRFYLPALGPITLLASWLVSRLHGVVAASLVGLLVCAALLSYNSMASGGGPGGGIAGPGGGLGRYGTHGTPPTGYGGANRTPPRGRPPGGVGPPSLG